MGVSRWDVLDVATRATAFTASRFLDSLQERAPCTVQGHPSGTANLEFQAEFEGECREAGYTSYC